ncbi:MAG: zinc-ribbon domain-containing protein [Myxococcota bacterium]
MIVTCPNCNAKYRVRDEAVPPSGAQLRCPECSTMFLARRPAHQEQELVEAVERLSQANQDGEQRIAQLERQLAESKAQRDVAEREIRRLREESAHVLATSQSAQRQAERRCAAAELELQAARANESLLQELQSVRASLAAEVTQLRQELMTCRQNSIARTAFEALQQTLDETRLLHQRQSDERNADRGVIAHLQEELQRVRGASANGYLAKLEQELTAARADLHAAHANAGPTAVDNDLRALVEALSPMLWALDQTLHYLGPFSVSEAVLAGHLRNLQLLAGLLRKLVETANMSRAPGR